MKVEFHLRRRTDAVREPAAAFLLFTDDAAEVLEACARLGCDPLPDIYRVPGGYLLEPTAPISHPILGAIMLRRLAANLLLPVDADLVPPLLDDEARGLVRDRGLIFLPGRRVLAFDPARPVPLADLVTVGNIHRPKAKAFLEPPALPDRISELLLHRPETAAEILESGAPNSTSLGPEPAQPGTASTAMGNFRYVAGRGLMNLGRALGLRGLAEMGANLIAGALARLPRLSEAVLGKQEATLRDLLREFREGNIEQALSRALPMGSEGDRGGTPSQTNQLPTHNLRYSLQDLLGQQAGPGGIWFGGYDVQMELVREYRKAAQEATARGDFRRAAFIYGKLLRDYRSAANVLMQGGLYHDAAILYLDKARDPLAAAKAFAAAGEIDRAVQLYRERGEHVEAGDLLRRSGEEEAARDEYRTAAEKLAATTKGCLAAGELLLSRGVGDGAREYFELGWNLSPHENAVPCGLHLARIYARDPKPDALLGLVAEADALFEPPGDEVGAGQFYNTIAELAARDNLAEVRETLRDRALVGLARKLRPNLVASSRAADIVSRLFGQAGHWSPALVTDAQAAARHELNRPRPDVRSDPALRWVRVAEEDLVAVTSARQTGEVFLAFPRGRLVTFSPADGKVTWTRLHDLSDPVGLTASPEGHLLVTAHPIDGLKAWTIRSYTRVHDFGCYAYETRIELPGGGHVWLTPALTVRDEPRLACWTGDRLVLLRGIRLLSVGEISPQALGETPVLGMLLSPSGFDWGVGSLFVCGTGTVLAHGPGWRAGFHSVRLGWSPVGRMDWLERPTQHVELAGVGEDRRLCWSLLLVSEEATTNVATHITPQAGYLAAAIVRPDVVVGVAADRIDWLRVRAKGFQLHATTRAAIPQAVACFTSHLTSEVLVVSRDGCVVRAPIP